MVVTTALLVALVGACSSGEEATPEDLQDGAETTSGEGRDAAEDFTRVEGEGFAFSYPASWETAIDEEGLIRVVDPDGPKEAVTYAEMEVDQTFSGDFDAAVDGVIGLAGAVQQPDRETLSDDEVEIAGAERARLVHSTFTGTGSALEVIDLFAVDDQGVLYYLAALSEAEVFDEPTFRAIAESTSLE